jgi:hypothetical protein
MEDIVSDVIEAGLDVVEIGANSKNKGCFWMSILIVVIAVGVTLYFVL